MSAERAVVIVSGGGAISPFTTPHQHCRTGMAAGSTDTGLREALLARGFAVYTSPANIGRTAVTADPDFAGFSDAPEQPPAELTVNAAGDIDEAGRSLSRFLIWLSEREQLRTIDLVVHSMGGLFSRAAIRELRSAASSLRIGSLTTLGTPFTGGYAADFARGDIPLEAAGGDPGTEAIMHDFQTLVENVSEGAGQQVTRHYLAGPNGWNERQGDQLDGIPLTLVAGDWFQQDDGHPGVFPHDGLVTLSSAFAEGVSSTVLRPAARHLFHDVHSIFFADQFDLPWERALTWDPDVFDVVEQALRAAGN
jgi:hypothetical protein